MWLSNEDLRRYEALRDAGYPFKLEEGTVVGRGYADVGYEEFIVLTGDRIFSVFTGKVAQFKPGDERFFFLVPDSDTIINEILKLGSTVSSVEFVDQRRWEISIKDSLGLSTKYNGPTFSMAVLEAFIGVLKGK